MGAIQHWHVTSGKCLHTIEEKDNQVFALDYRFDGAYFATVGKDPVVKVYDEATKTQTLTMQVTFSSLLSSSICYLFTCIAPISVNYMHLHCREVVAMVPLPRQDTPTEFLA